MKKQENVRLYPVFTKLDIPLQIICLLLIGISIGSVINTISTINSSIPSTFSLQGAVTAYSDKFSILTYLIISILIYSLGWFLETHLHLLRYPCIITEDNAEKLYKPMRVLIIVSKTEVCLYSLYMVRMIKIIAINKKGSLFPYSQIIFIAMLLLTVVIGYLILSLKSKNEPKEA